MVGDVLTSLLMSAHVWGSRKPGSRNKLKCSAEHGLVIFITLEGPAKGESLTIFPTSILLFENDSIFEYTTIKATTQQTGDRVGRRFYYRLAHNIK